MKLVIGLSSLLVGILVTLAAILLLVPGLIVWCVYAVAVPVCVVESLGLRASMTRSSFLTKGNRWRIFGVFALIFIASIVIGGMVGGLAGLAGGVHLVQVASFAIEAGGRRVQRGGGRRTLLSIARRQGRRRYRANRRRVRLRPDENFSKRRVASPGGLAWRSPLDASTGRCEHDRDATAPTSLAIPVRPPIASHPDRRCLQPCVENVRRALGDLFRHHTDRPSAAARDKGAWRMDGDDGSERRPSASTISV